MQYSRISKSILWIAIALVGTAVGTYSLPYLQPAKPSLEKLYRGRYRRDLPRFSS